MSVNNPIEPIDPEAVDIPGWPGYRISKNGTVWSSRKIGRGKKDPSMELPEISWRRITLGISKRGGYPIAKLNTGGRNRTAGTHILVLETFVGPRPQGLDACHNDGNPQNCSLSNLRWDTRTNNNADKIRHGTLRIGSRHQNSKLIESEVVAIRARHLQGESIRSLASECGVTELTAWKAITRRTWKHT